MRTSIELLQESATLLDKVDHNLRCFGGMHCENSPDALLTDILLDEVENLSFLISRLIFHYNSKN